MQQDVVIHGQTVTITAFLKPNTKGVWIARGDYNGKNPQGDVKGTSAKNAISNWIKASKYHNNW